jgi:ADP-ribose pyrophosphatase YjhB (NUDIX family)
MMLAPDWLRWSRALQAIAQTGLLYAEDPFDVERYSEVRRLAAEIAAAGSNGDMQLIERFFSSERGYPTPKLDVRAAVISDGQILLVREQDDGGWSMPGGWTDVGESAAESVVRETREEAGLEVRAVKLIALYERERRGHPFHPEFSYKAFFLCEPVMNAELSPPTAAHETTEARFFDVDQLPPLSLARVTPEEVATAVAHHLRPELPTEFD